MNTFRKAIVRRPVLLALAAGLSIGGVAIFRAVGSPTARPSEPASTEFDGEIAGWRIAPEDVLIEAGLFGGPLNGLTCRAREVGPRVATDLDINVTYLPQGMAVRGQAVVSKVKCDELATIVSVRYELDAPAGVATLEIVRERVDHHAYAIEADSDRVSAGTIGGRPAVFVRTNPVNGEAEIAVIEDGTFDPDAVVLRLISENVSFSELEHVAEGVR